MFAMATPLAQGPNPRLDVKNQKRILIAEDEVEIRKLIALHLKREGFAVDEVGDGDQARQQIGTQPPYDLFIFDWMMPSLSGLELTQWVRGLGALNHLPILFVTAKTEPEHIASGLNAGADDYLTKPFDTLVLLARVNALLRRRDWLKAQSEPGIPAAQLKIGDLSLNRESYVVTLAGQNIDLTRSEFRLLESLMMNQGKVLSRESLIGEIQGEGVNVVGRTIDTHIFGLRKKLGAWADNVETIRGVGYRVRFMQETNSPP